MAYTEKVSLSGTALSFLLYECINSKNGQEGLLIGDITSEITNHISDSHNDNARLDTQIVIRTVLPLPTVSLFYCPTGRIKEDVLTEILSTSANEVVGWYKYRRNGNLKPTFRDKLISKGLQKYFERHHGKKTFVSCSLSSKTSVCSSTHTFTYRFGKMNCFNMYEYIDDVTGNLGEKVTGYKKPHRCSAHSIFNKIVKESNVQTGNTSEAILCIQEAVNKSLDSEAKQAVKYENKIRELEAEIKEMSSILLDRQALELQNSLKKAMEMENINIGVELASSCVEALNKSHQTELYNNICISNKLDVTVTQVKQSQSSPGKPVHNSSGGPRIVANSNNTVEDLISFDEVDNKVSKKRTPQSEVTYVEDSSPEY